MNSKEKISEQVWSYLMKQGSANSAKGFRLVGIEADANGNDTARWKIVEFQCVRASIFIGVVNFKHLALVNLHVLVDFNHNIGETVDKLKTKDWGQCYLLIVILTKFRPFIF